MSAAFSSDFIAENDLIAVNDLIAANDSDARNVLMHAHARRGTAPESWRAS
ncbi:hypothetical protein SAMN05192539_1001447 [Paraburkholderia diazotrophica]|uniref:Uncharacterized protein n=1 Tax=Paraburkholderia diazotrophica TaxID=667676 RepID=A0A1H6QUS1_9BURK|nr:hypothetical protein SAMN05192539_1001447 [Paraburkholderia diazotrophica]